MKLADFEPDHVRRAAGFQKDAEKLLRSNRNLIQREVFENTSWTDDQLTGLGMMLPMSDMDRDVIEKMRDTNDRNSADETAILIYTTAMLDSVLNLVADDLDSLAVKWQALQERHNTHDDIHPVEDGSEDDGWVLSTTYVFRDLS